jgi:hypothetical protein
MPLNTPRIIRMDFPQQLGCAEIVLLIDDSAASKDSSCHGNRLKISQCSDVWFDSGYYPYQP